MKRILLLFTSLVLVAFASFAGEAAKDKAPGTGVNATFAKLFGPHKAFTATVNVLVAGQQKMTMPMELALAQNQMRMEVDLTSIRVDGQPQAGTDMFKRMGLDRVITISRLDQKASLIIVPGMKATVDTPMPEDEAASLDGEARVETTELGKETIDGHPCAKNRFVITDKKGRKREGLVWNAADLKEFPVQMLMVEGSDQVILRFKNIKFQQPDAKLFAVPSGYKAFDSMSDLNNAAIARLPGGARK